jgi:FMN-dependent NADH-azoreductase
MKNVLLIQSSPSGENSQTRKIIDAIKARIKSEYGEVAFKERDLVTSNLPHVQPEDITTLFARDEALNTPFNARSMELINELRWADLIVIGMPMYNFSVPSNLKAWIDHIARAGITFSYSPQGPIGTLNGKKAILATSAGGVYSSGPMQVWDFSEPFVRTLLNVLGIKDIQAVRVEGLSVPELAVNALPNALKDIERLQL